MNDEDEGVTAADHSETYISFTLLQTIWLILRFYLATRTRYLLRLLAHPDVRNMIRFTDDFDEDELSLWPRRRGRRSTPDPNRFPKVPSVAGAELMASGYFGSNDAQSRGSDPDIRKRKQRKRLARRILDREIASGNFVKQRINRKTMAQVRNTGGLHSFILTSL